MNNITRLQLIEGPQNGYLEVKEGAKVPLNFSVSDIRDISSRSGMYSKTIALAGTKNNNNILNNYFDVNIIAGTFDVNKRQKVAIVQNGVILRDNCYMRLLKVKKKQSVDTSVDEYVEYEVQVTDELGDFFKEVGNKEVKELSGWERYKHIYGVDAVVASFDHTVDDAYKYTLPWIKREVDLGYDYTMNDLMPGIYAKQIFDRIHILNGFSYDWATIDDEDTQFNKSILPYAGDKKKLTEEYIDSVRVEVDNNVDQSYTLFQPNNMNSVNKGYDITIDKNVIDPEGLYDVGNSAYNNPFIISPPNSLNYSITIEWELSVTNITNFKMAPRYGYNSYGNTLEDTETGVRVFANVKRGPSTLNSTVLNQVTFDKFNSPSGDAGGLWGEEVGIVGDDGYINMRRGFIVQPNSTRRVATGSQTMNIPIQGINTGDILKINSNMISRTVDANSFWRANNNNVFLPVDMRYNMKIKNISISISPNANNGLMPGTEIDLKNFLPSKMKQSDFLKTIFQKYNLFVEVDPDNPSKLVYTSRDKFYDDGTIKDWTKKLDKKKEQELYFIPDITTKRMILSYKDDDKDSLLDAYRGETSKTFGQVDAIFDNENIKGEERKEEMFSPTINMETEFGAILPVLSADFKMNPRILQDGGKLSCQPYSLKESDNKTITSSFYPHLSMFDKPFNPTFSTEYAQSSYYAYNTGLFTENNLYNLHWRRTLAQINSGKMLKAWFWLTEEDIQGLRMNDKIKINNAYYYINAVIDYDANSNSATKVELLTVEDDLKLPRVGGGRDNVGTIADAVIGTARPRVPSTPGGFFNDAISTVVKKRYDESVVLSGPTPLTGNLGMSNTLASGFRGVVIGDNLRPTDNGFYVNKDIKLTTEGLDVPSVNTKSLIVDGTEFKDGGTTFKSSYLVDGYIDDEYFEGGSAFVGFDYDEITDEVTYKIDADKVEFTGEVDFSNAIVPELNNKENNSNKVQDLSSPNANTYPSTDAVKNALNSKIESVTGIGVDNTDPINPTISIDKNTIGLGNVDNIKQIPLAEKGANNGVAELDSSGKIPVSQLPSYVSDVETYPTLSSFPVTGVDNIIYITQDTNLTYRWTGSAYVEISPSIALGETSSTAYRGDRGKIAYDHSQLTSGNPHNVTKTDVGLSDVDNTSDADKPISTATQNALNDKVESVTGVSGVPVNNTDPNNPIIGLQDRLPILDRPSTDPNPQWYSSNYPQRIINEFKLNSAVVGLSSIFTSGNFCTIETITPKTGLLGGRPFQIATNSGDGKMARRYGVSDTTWSAWQEVTFDGVQSISRVPGVVGLGVNIDNTDPKNPKIGLQDRLPFADTRLTNENPQWYFTNLQKATTNEFKTINVMGLASIFTSGTYCGVETINQWSDASGGYPFQIATHPNSGKMAKRYGVTATSWSPWVETGGDTISNTGPTPTSTSDTSGTVGELRFNNTYIYIKTSAGWKRTTLSTF